MDSPPGHGPIWTWSYLDMVLFGLDQKRPEKNKLIWTRPNPPVRPIDIPTRDSR